MRGHADGAVAVVAVEDVGAVLRRGHPGRDDGRGSGVPERAPGDVLTDFEADLRAVYVARGAHPRLRRVAAGTDVFEVVAEGHALGVRLRGRLQLPVGLQRALAAGDAFAVDQAQRGAASQL